MVTTRDLGRHQAPGKSSPALRKLVTNVRDAVKAAGDAGDAGAALRFVADQGDIALWATRNTDKLADFERVQNTFPPGTVNALKHSIDSLVALSGDLAKAFPGDEAAAQAALRRFTETSTMFPQGGTTALEQVAAAAKGLRDVSPAAVPDFVRDIDTIRDVSGANKWWTKVYGQLGSEGDGHLGYAFEASQAAKLKNAGQLDSIDQSIEDVLFNGEFTDVQVDAFAKSPTGKNILTEFKSKKDPAKAVGSTPSTRTQMERQAKAVADKANDPNLNLEREIHWRFSSRSTEPLADYASEMQMKYGVRIRFFDANGVEFTV